MKILIAMVFCVAPSMLMAQWLATGSISHVRYVPSAVKLSDGRVLLSGGRATGSYDAKPDSSCEIYDPHTGTWSEAAPMKYARSGHSSILLPDHRVLVADGGPRVCELYDPAADSWMPTDSLLVDPYYSQQDAELGPNGNIVLVSYEATYTAIQMFDYHSEKWSLSYSPLPSLYAFKLTKLGDNILVTGGSWGRSCEIIDGNNGTWQMTNSMNEGHSSHAAVELSNGDILVTGGEDYRGTSMHPKSSCELLNPDTLVWRYVTPMNLPRIDHQAVLLRDGRVLVVGGYYELFLPPRTGSELYIPETDQWVISGDMQYSRSGFSMTVLDDSTVLIAGGCDTTVCELFHPEPTGVRSFVWNGPREFELSQNYPDPFNPSTTITYRIPKRSFVSLKVYDALGREAAVLVLGEQSAGSHSVVFNARNLSSGVYFYTLQAGGINQNRKMMLLK